MMGYKHKINIVLLLFILFLGTFLRIYKLDFEEIWYDESVSIQAAKMSYSDMFQYSLKDGGVNFPPVYYFLLKNWVYFFGDSPLSARMPSVLFGLLGIWMMYLLGKILWDETHGLLAALFMALSPFHIYYSQEARVYTLLIFLLCVALYYFLKSMKDNNSKNWWIYTGVILLAIHSHFFSIFIWISLVCIHFVYQFLSTKSFRHTVTQLFYQWIILAGIIPLLIFRWMSYSADLNTWIQPFQFYMYRHTLKQLILGVIHTDYKWMYHFGVILFIICVGVTVYNCVQLFIQQKNKKSNHSLNDLYITLWLIGLIIIPVVIFTVFSLTIHDIYVSWRYLIIVLPSFILWFSRSFLLIPWRFITLILIFIYAGILLSIQYREANHLNKIGLKSVAKYMQMESHREDTIIFVPSYNSTAFFYYFREPMRTLHSYGNLGITEAIQKAHSESSRIWLVSETGTVHLVEHDYVFSVITSEYKSGIDKTENLPPFNIQVKLFVN